MRFGDSHEPLKNMNDNCVTQVNICYSKYRKPGFVSEKVYIWKQYEITIYIGYLRVYISKYFWVFLKTTMD